jgi:transposase
MLIGHPRQKVYLAVGATDLRKAVDGLAAIVQLDFELNPFEPCLFAFCKFDEAIKASGGKKKNPKALEGLEFINKL